MSVNGFSYAGVRLPNVTVLEKKIPYWAPKSNELVKVPGLPGALFMGQEVDALPIDLTVLVDGVQGIPFNLTAEEFASWLNGYDEPQPLVFDSHPDRTYFAKLEGDVSADEVVQFAKVQLSFICPDPYKYGNEKTATPVNGAHFTVGGTVKTPPVIEVTMKSPSTFVAIGTGEKVNMIGRSADVDQSVVNRLTRVYWSEADTISGWVPPASSEEGAISGTMESTGHLFQASDYGTGAKWHGPALKRGIPETLTNFQVDALIELMNLPNYDARGKIVVSGLDASNRVVFSMQMGDGYATPKNLGLIRAGDLSTGKNILAHSGEPPSWNNFKGLVRVGRNKGRWFAYVARLVGGKESVRMYKEWGPGTGAQFDRNISQVQVHLMSYGTSPVARPRLEDIKVYKINDVADNQVPLITESGDVVTFDHKEGTISKNGVDIVFEKAFIGEYFFLEPGLQTIIAEPSDKIKSVKVRWRDKWH